MTLPIESCVSTWPPQNNSACFQNAHQGRAALHGAQVAPGTLLEIAEVGGAVIRHGVMLEIAPDAFDRVQFRSVGRQVLECDGATRGLQAVPDDQQLATDRRLQGLQELEHLRRADRAGNRRK